MKWKSLKNKITKKNIIVVFLSTILLLGGVLSVSMSGKAHEAAITVETETGTAKRLSEFRVNVTIESPEPITTIEAYLSYDSSVIEFVSSETPSIVGNGGILRIADFYPEGATKATYELTFSALELGNSSLELYDIKAEGAEDAQAVDIQSRSSAVEVIVNRSEPTDARLYDLLVADGKLKPDFNSNIYEYTIKVPYEIETLMFSAEPINEDSVVTLEQEKTLQHGDNIILIRVTSPSGIEKVYTLNVYRALTEDEILEDEILEDESEDSAAAQTQVEEEAEEAEDTSEQTDGTDQENGNTDALEDENTKQEDTEEEIHEEGSENVEDVENDTNNSNTLESNES